MDFRLTEEQVMFKETARKFAETEIAPLIPQMEEKQRTPAELIKKMRELSFYAVQYPAEYGGVGSTYLEYAMVIEQLSQGVLLHRRTHFRQLPVRRNDQRFRNGGAEEKVSARNHRRRRRGQLCVHGAFDGLRPGRHPDDLRPGRQRLGHQRRKDLHYQFDPARIHRRFLQGRGKGQQDHQHHRPQEHKGILHAEAR